MTGIPRGGLTVAAALLDGFPNTVCINHPVWQLRKAAEIDSAELYCDKIIRDFDYRRQQLLSKDPIADIRATDGSPVLDGLHDFRQPYDEAGQRAFIAFTRDGLSDDFSLAMKQHVLYTALLPALIATRHFAVIAVIRHPLDVMISWLKQSGQRAFAQGKLADDFKPFWPEAAHISHNWPRMQRMLALYDSFCQRYYDARHAINILKYEELVENPSLMATLIGAREESKSALHIDEKQRVYQASVADEIRSAIKAHTTYAKYFYTV
ncbi:MAG: sulfotransferase domain-containing protein [Rickettsiales bacterium]|nr:sulfotransferase domain-containing protein [Rickettsiales bacterium]